MKNVYIAILFSIIGLICFHYFWIKETILTIWVATFSFGYNLIYIIWLNVINSFKEFNFYYSVLIFNYHIFLGIAFVIAKSFIGIAFVFAKCFKGIFYCFVCIINRFLEGNYSSDEFKIFGTILLQYFIIAIFVSIGIVTELYETFDYNDRDKYLCFATSCNGRIYDDNNDDEDACCSMIYNILYVPMMILFFLLFTSFTNGESITYNSFISNIF